MRGVTRKPSWLVPLCKLSRQFTRDCAIIDLLHVVDAGEDHRGVELAAEDVDRARDAGLTARAETVEARARDHAVFPPERERAEDILPRADSGIYQHFLLPADRIRDFRQRRNR